MRIASLLAVVAPNCLAEFLEWLPPPTRRRLAATLSGAERDDHDHGATFNATADDDEAEPPTLAARLARVTGERFRLVASQRSVADEALDLMQLMSASSALAASSEARGGDAMLANNIINSNNNNDVGSNNALAIESASSGAVGGVGGVDDARAATQARQRALAALFQQLQASAASTASSTASSTSSAEAIAGVRAGARSLVAAAALFGNGIDKRFLQIMQEHHDGTLDRRQVVERYNELFADALVAPAEGAVMKAALQTLRARAVA